MSHAKVTVDGTVICDEDIPWSAQGSNRLREIFQPGGDIPSSGIIAVMNSLASVISRDKPYTGELTTSAHGFTLVVSSE